MNIDKVISDLEAEWDPTSDDSFFGKVRNGELDLDGFERVKVILDSVSIPDDASINRRLVELIWFIPTFLHWQRWAWKQDGKETNRLDEVISFFEQRITTILGIP